MRRAIPLFVIGLLLASAQPLFAQQRLILMGNRDIFDVDSNLSTFGRVTRRFAWESTAKVFDMTPIAAGAFVAWTNNDGVIHVLDVQSGSRQQYTIPGVAVGRILATDETTFRVLLLGSFPFTGSPPAEPPHAALAVVDLLTGSVRTMDLGAQTTSGMVYAARAHALFAGRPAGASGPIARVDVINVDTGEMVKTLPVSAGQGQFLQSVDPAGTRLFLTGPDGLTVLDATTGARVGGVPSAAVINSPPTIDDHRNRVVVTLGTYPNQRLAAFALDSLEPLGEVAWQALGIPAPQILDVSPQSASMLALTKSPGQGCNFFTLAALNADTGQLRTSVALPELRMQLYDCDDVAMVRLTEPSAPRNFAATTTGSHVEFTWSPEGAIRYELDAGSAPGLADLATVALTDTHLTIDGVPPGVYYLRVRAINTIGESAPSQEIRVVVE